jgi:hypothetical protein
MPQIRYRGVVEQPEAKPFQLADGDPGRYGYRHPNPTGGHHMRRRPINWGPDRLR